MHVLEAIGLRDDESVLIHGAAGGVGLMAVQLAAGRGATVLGTASPAEHDLLRDLGAIPVAYGPGLADRVRAAAPEGVHAAADNPAGKPTWLFLPLAGTAISTAVRTLAPAVYTQLRRAEHIRGARDAAEPPTDPP
ncbi:hypothetical protein [Streptomyces scabichelini]|uniref:hypothetical protein n=1 Tax=Streptomyces scabichelini TaxID=2711217 RepID=UPI001F495F4E|nr:hypothetical protein [Streptomyces scabichelini]